MLLIAVSAPVGGGKSTLLLEVATRLIGRGRAVTGFLQVAGERREGVKGAEWYDLLFLPDGERLRWATRSAVERPRYVFSPEASARVTAWAMQVRPADLAVLDEFGRLEAEGGGHFSAWEAVAKTEPAIALVGVRDDRIAEVGAKLGRPFDLVIDAQDPQAADRLEALCAEARDWEAVGVFGAGAGALEATLGSALHAAKVPLRGQALSTLQALVLTSAAEGLQRRERVGWVAVVSAGLKALSPAGSRLRPMLAITVQGLLFALSLRLLGWRAAAVFTGGLLVGAWAAGQGILLQWLMVGDDLFKAYDEVVKWVARQLGLASPALPVVLGAVIAVSALTTGLVTAGFWRARHRGLERLRQRLPRAVPAARRGGSPFWATVREIAHPTFWVPIALILGVLLLSGTRWESAVWIALRALAVALVLFGAVRLLKVDRLGEALRRRGLYGPAAAVSRAFRRPE